MHLHPKSLNLTNIDSAHCPKCGGVLNNLAQLEYPAMVGKILTYIYYFRLRPFGILTSSYILGSIIFAWCGHGRFRSNLCRILLDQR